MKGILMTPDNQRAIQLYLKTVTRRLDGLKEINLEPYDWVLGGWDNGYKAFVFYKLPLAKEKQIIKPRYKVGETVYIKEAWATENKYNHLKPRDIPRTAKIFYLSEGYDPFKMGRKRSPLFMMEWAARDFLQIKDVRPERLQEITLKDCKAEGITAEPYEECIVENISSFWIGRYEELWDSINKNHKWETNPFIWRYEFTRVEK